MSFFVGGTLTGLFSSVIRNSRIISPAILKTVQGSLSESQEFRQKSAFLDQSLVPALIVFAISVSTAFAGGSGPSRSQFYSDSTARGVGSVIDVIVIPYFVFDEE